MGALEFSKSLRCASVKFSVFSKEDVAVTPDR